MILLHKKFFIVEKVLQIIKILTLRRKKNWKVIWRIQMVLLALLRTPFWNLYLSVYEILLKCFLKSQKSLVSRYVVIFIANINKRDQILLCH